MRIAGSEPRLAARLPQTANLVVFNPADPPAPHLRAAVTRLVHQAVQSVAMVFAIQLMKAEPTLRPVAKPLHDLWERSIAVASICEVVARQLHVPTDKVFLTGPLHGIGHIYIIVWAAEASSEVAYEQLPADLLAAWHPSIGRAVLAKWGFEAVVCEAVGLQHDHARQVPARLLMSAPWQGGAITRPGHTMPRARARATGRLQGAAVPAQAKSSGGQ